MNDETEWAEWTQAWRGASGQLPALAEAAQFEQRRHRFASRWFWLSCALGLGLSGFAFSAGVQEPAVRPIGWLIVAFFGAMAAAYAWASRRTEQNDGALGPRQALRFMRQRLVIEARTAHVIRWGYAALFLAFAVVFPDVVASHEAPEVELRVSFSAVAIMAVVTFAAPWWVARKNRPQTVQLEQWQAWLDAEELRDS